ncbi:MAG TPA: hypothetical protein VF533_18750 [Solirubrobacteraceae bacterium]|jgi:hypothetical protein
MRRAKWMCALAAAVVAAAGLPAAATAGTYTVRSCGAPGAGGANKAWTTGFTDLGGNAHPEQFNVVAQCPGNPSVLAMQSKNAAGVDATWTSSGYFQLDTGSDDLRLRELTLWRWGLKFASAEGEREWNLFGQTDSSALYGEDCLLSNGGCQTGSGEPMSAASRTVHQLNNRWVRFGVVCAPEDLKSCRTADDRGGPKAGYGIWGSVATIEDVKDPTGLAVGGALAADGWHRRSDSFQVSAADASGIRTVRLSVDGLDAVTVGRGCDALVVKTCPDAAGVTLDPTAATVPIGDGDHQALISVVDAAGNVASVARPLRIDENGPQLSVRRPKGATIVADAVDAASGLAGAQIETRTLPDGPYTPVETRIEGGQIVGRAAGDAGRLGIRVAARDVAGNQTVVEGLPSALRLGGARVGGKQRAIRRGRVRARLGREVRLRGRLRGADGQPLGGRQIAVSAALRRVGAARLPLATVTTAADGSFGVAIPRGASRLVRLEYAGGAGSLPSARSVSVRIPAASTIRASRHVLRGPRPKVRFSGRLKTAGEPLPRLGKLVELQAFDRGRWRQFASTRARGKRARWTFTYRFGGRPGRYPIRARIRRESTYPFELGYSRRIVIRER